MTFPIRFRRSSRLAAADSQITDAQQLSGRTSPEPCTAETAECTCPEFCERDHGNE